MLSVWNLKALSTMRCQTGEGPSTGILHYNIIKPAAAMIML